MNSNLANIKHIHARLLIRIKSWSLIGINQTILHDTHNKHNAK